ncbi:hypothetical protein NCCP133_16200 [Cytobacillus sp. NCCP-133]|nr:hypothetical protein NCCP133_16200 [Cytobacillus sp. NCCP-133]
MSNGYKKINKSIYFKKWGHLSKAVCCPCNKKKTEKQKIKSLKHFPQQEDAF